MAVAFAFAALATFWAPGMALLSDAAEDAGLDLALAFAISNLAWAVGRDVFGAGLGGAVASATSDAVPYAALAVACAVTYAGLSVGMQAATRGGNLAKSSARLPRTVPYRLTPRARTSV